MLLVRLDANDEIGSGHAIRCIAYADAARRVGHQVLFAVSDGQSRAFLAGRGQNAVVLPGDPMALGVSDGVSLAVLARSTGADAVLVDSYAVDDGFFAELRGLRAAYVDDAYTFVDGDLGCPRRWDVDIIVNYGFGFSEGDYADVYREAGTMLLIGPGYAPVRDAFTGASCKVGGVIERVLITTGSTNPGRSLEKMAEGCRRALGDDVTFDIVVGPMAEFEGEPYANLVIHRGVGDLSGLMAAADMAVSAAGSTLYELARVGVPTAVFPIVVNQMGNVRGVARRQLGIAHADCGWTPEDVTRSVERMASDPAMRKCFSEAMRSAVDGRGPDRVAAALLTDKQHLAS